jgi:hypothetical protein
LNQVRTFSLRSRRREKAARGDQPVALGFADLAGDDLDGLAADRRMIERHQAAVQLRAATAMPDIGVDVVGEIEHGRAFRQVHDLALRRQQVDAVLDHFGLQTGEQRGIGFGIGLGLEHVAQAGNLALERGVAAAAFLVAPVRGDAEFGVFVHFRRADLDLQRLAFRADDRRVQRAVVVALGARDVIVELARHRRPQGMHEAERGITGRHVLDHQPHRADVVQARRDRRACGSSCARSNRCVSGDPATSTSMPSLRSVAVSSRFTRSMKSSRSPRRSSSALAMRR